MNWFTSHAAQGRGRQGRGGEGRGGVERSKNLTIWDVVCMVAMDTA